MTAVRLISYEELSKRLAPYGCKRLAQLGDGIELWQTGWDYPFTMQAGDGGLYDDWQYRRVLAHVIAKTMPPDWVAGAGD